MTAGVVATANIRYRTIIPSATDKRAHRFVRHFLSYSSTSSIPSLSLIVSARIASQMLTLKRIANTTKKMPFNAIMY